MKAKEDRPKTSRGVANPSPDEFASYVVPSPDAAKVRQKHVHSFAKMNKGNIVIQEEETETESDNSMESANKHDAHDNTNYDDMNDDDSDDLLHQQRSPRQEEKVIIALGCWLFGSALYA